MRWEAQSSGDLTAPTGPSPAVKRSDPTWHGDGMDSDDGMDRLGDLQEEDLK